MASWQKTLYLSPCSHQSPNLGAHDAIGQEGVGPIVAHCSHPVDVSPQLWVCQEPFLGGAVPQAPLEVLQVGLVHSACGMLLLRGGAEVDGLGQFVVAPTFEFACVVALDLHICTCSIVLRATGALHEDIPMAEARVQTASAHLLQGHAQAIRIAEQATDLGIDRDESAPEL